MDGGGLKGSVARAFEPAGIQLRIDQLQMLRPVTVKVRRSKKFAQIVASIAEVGVIEPPVVVRHPKNPNTYLLLDGHLRIEALRLAGAEEVLCLVATDDEAFTYNKRISRLAAVQEHRMILRAIEKKVPEERLARALNIDVVTLRQKRRALDGVCPEAVEMLKDKPVALSAFSLLRRMQPLRQIAVAEMMIGFNCYSRSYLMTLLTATPESQLVPSSRPKQVRGLTPDQVALMERESAHLEREVKVAEQSYGADNLHLAVTVGYLKKLLAVPRIGRYLRASHPDLLDGLQKITEADPTGA
ncbi:Chromosome partitioning protein parB (plasmid) [Roseomonas mucosa]|uniref:Plasmid partitioning protein n=1 Tax=Roseomonas mucosa TaxID=207340 RepID=A0A379PR66_9PROT|nr:MULTISPECIES: plasmid partitioning protein RepB C-terminal domain-containing protein [Roseomonas]MBS5905344.1 ParB N-terminal domain-containing protein [Acetobacteraceae bacterium]MCG7353979.1 ParB N-terminal domain-containing protein [Roseomonas mucosa]MCG7358945.1 ParB N-terminal domain-containing protein [Roseomonas mucosa]MDT8292104.1 plasmid partitioning protein RepB C-terminal domain-containing protein [Roseomonas mucosa]MDT8296282.1 plasmid partitioning protein RepB C-terminal domain